MGTVACAVCASVLAVVFAAPAAVAVLVAFIIRIFAFPSCGAGLAVACCAAASVCALRVACSCGVCWPFQAVVCVVVSAGLFCGAVASCLV